MNSSTLHHHHRTTLTPHFTSSKRHRSDHFSTTSSIRRFRPPLRRHLRRNLLHKPLPTTTPPPLSTAFPETSFPISDHTLHLHIPLHPPDYLNILLRDSKLYLNQFILNSEDAVQDLRTLITFDNRNNYSSVSPHSGPRRLVVSCKRSTVAFLGTVLVSSFAIAYAFRVVLKVGRILFSWKGNRGGEGKVVYKADRSLGGKLVAVGSNDASYRTGKEYGSLKSDGESFLDWGGEVEEWRRERGKTAGLPKWWPKENVGYGIGGMLEDEEKEEYQKLANRFIRGSYLCFSITPYLDVVFLLIGIVV